MSDYKPFEIRMTMTETEEDIHAEIDTAGEVTAMRLVSALVMLADAAANALEISPDKLITQLRKAMEDHIAEEIDE